MSKLANNPNFDYLGIKLLSMPIESATIERRIGVNYDAVSILNLIIFLECIFFSQINIRRCWQGIIFVIKQAYKK
jgi:hypothetical protein